MVMHSKDHFQQVGSFFTQNDSIQDEFEPDIPTGTPLKQESTIAPEIKTENESESMPTSKKSNLQERKPEQPSGKMEIPIQAERPSTTEDEFHTLKEEWISPFKQHQINSLKRELDKYKDPKAMYKAQGSNAFTRAYRKTMTRDEKLRTNIERRNKLTERLNQLRGEYNSIDHLNENKQLVLSLLTPLSNSYANFKSIRGYVNSVLDWAEELEYIQVNKVKKTISRIKANKKLALKESKKFEDLALNEEELKQWLQAFDEDLKKDRMELKDYALFYTTFFLSDRKSETYALQWKHINFEKNEILIEQSLDKFGNLKSTKGNKKTLFKAPKELMNILIDWKIEQKKQLKLFGIKQNEKQFVFTYNNRKNGINVPLHIDYLNHRMNTIRRRHPELSPASPHKLRHTGATLARRAGTSLNAISEALTHSDIQITKTYVNTTETVNQTAGEIAFRSLKKQ